MKINILKEASQELEAAVSFYEDKVEGLGLDLEYEVRQSFYNIVEKPTIFSPDSRGIRKYLINRFPFMVHYSIDESTIRVWAIAHTKRKPNYWKSGKK